MAQEAYILQNAEAYIDVRSACAVGAGVADDTEAMLLHR